MQSHAGESEPYATPRRLKRAEYERMVELGFFDGEHVELIRGVIVRMSPQGPSHSSPLQNLSFVLTRRLPEGAQRSRVTRAHTCPSAKCMSRSSFV